MTKLTAHPEWTALKDHFQQIKTAHLRELFQDDPDRAAAFSLERCGLFLDYSKNRVTRETMEKLFALARRVDLAGAIQDMFAGQRINRTEDRAVLHTALRNRSGKPVFEQHKDGGARDVMSDVSRVLDKMARFADEVRDGSWRGYTGERIRHVVNIGIGGSDLGPAMACRALTPFCDRDLTVRFVSNVDPSSLSEALRGLEPRRTLFIVASKTFTTLETMSNARAARWWLLEALGSAALADDPTSREARGILERHFVSLSTAHEKVGDFGLNDRDNVFEFWDWVGGRYSLTSAIGLPLMIAVGPDNFTGLLEGFHAMDEHFRSAEFELNMPVILAMLGIWYNNFFQWETHAILPYADYLDLLPAYLQQADMESNGKTVTLEADQQIDDYQTGPIIWGRPGTNGQHAFFQLLHQGSKHVSADFIGFARSYLERGDRQEKLIANMLAQTEALALGKTFEEVKQDRPSDQQPMPDWLVRHRTFEGNRPTNTIFGENLDPQTLGALIALYEHKIFVQGVIWGINSFDQWGVELGKQLATRVMGELDEATPLESIKNPSTRQLSGWYRRRRRRSGCA